ncbi:hypothetical protein [Nocardiopsis sp. JB363]|uniref:hypothetical protein n=1 Tax=Nocardiopsis sp. JB363 TaxID=1434837 RepID=UPI00097B0F53|nr:hypothetical protein [Nocardiopsis sp. JB363]SIO86978.1 hypothetical protein BQ8420_14555 [Nocardiopsis sp. JB363]
MTAFADLAFAAMPCSLGIAVLGSGLIGYRARGVRVDLAAERELVARLTVGADDIIAAARGAHHRTAEETDRG